MAWVDSVFTVLQYNLSFLGITFNLLDVLGFELITSVVALFIGRVIFFNSDAK